jgi:hypothetical protein
MKYRLLKDYESPTITIRAGVIKEDVEWLKIFPTTGNLFSKEDWFAPCRFGFDEEQAKKDLSDWLTHKKLSDYKKAVDEMTGYLKEMGVQVIFENNGCGDIIICFEKKEKNKPRELRVIYAADNREIHSIIGLPQIPRSFYENLNDGKHKSVLFREVIE